MRKLVLILLIAAAPFALADKRVHKTVPLDANGSVVISTHNGTVTVTTWSQPNVDIDARIEPVAGGDPADVDKTEVKISGSGSSVRIESDYDAVLPHMKWFSLSRDLPPVHYTISMPATARLDVSGHNARVKVNGLRSDVNVESHNGPVDVVDFDGAANVETHNGDVSIGFNRFAKASRIETHNGSVQVTVPADTRLHVDASGHHLGVESELGVAATRVSDSHYSGDVNGGGPELRFESHNGTLRLKKR